tara:strand:+ start:149 stop:526 length:378 start_codon:yes stop_codon:yes gene_type:complete
MKYLNHTKAQLKKMSKPALVSIGTAILKRLPKNTLVTTIHTMEQLAKRHGIKSVGRIARKVKRKVKAIKRRTTKRGMKRKTARRAYMPKSYSMYNGRRKTKRRGRLRKGSPEAKRYMARIRAMRA